MQHDNINLNDVQDNISMPNQVFDELDEGKISPSNLESFCPVYAQSQQIVETSGSRGTERKVQMIKLVESQLEKMSNELGLVVDALNKDNISMPNQVFDELDEGKISPSNLESFCPVYAQSQQIVETSGSRGTERKVQMIKLVESQLEKMSNELGLVVDALNKAQTMFLMEQLPRENWAYEEHEVIFDGDIVTGQQMKAKAQGAADSVKNATGMNQ
ncbi:unnamed protein product [Lupinus luteus]|uniref:Uncharacterized protein n=1 Tax=Lupinus luteus TaxID=3873 RepID=A0AAV1XKT7_LUPLU